MIPEHAAVVAAAEAMVDNGWSGGAAEHDAALRALTEAVEALRMRRSRPAGQPTYEEQDRTWGEVVIGDEILSEKTGKWYEVIRSVVDERAGTIKVNIKNVPHKPIIRPIGDPVKLKRGVSGDAADLFQLLWSDTYTLGAAAKADSTGSGPMITEQEESDED